MSSNFKFRRGDQLKDLITGFEGTVVSRLDNITGCNRYCLQPPTDKDGKYQDACWFDEHQLQIDKTKTRLVIEHLQQADPPG